MSYGTDYDAIRAATEERQRRMAIRDAEQLAAHMADPQNVPMYVPVDDPDWPDETFTAGWQQDEPDDPRDIAAAIAARHQG
jgi:hypothetical protein